MATKFWRLKIKGEKPMDEILALVGRNGGSLLRVHFEGGETHAYFAGEKSAADSTAKSIKEARKPEEVTAKDVTKLG